MIELQRCTDQEIWDDYILENGGHPMQLWGWGQLKMAHGWSADRLLAYDEEEIVAAAQVLSRKLPLPLRGFSYVPRGPIGEQGRSEEFLNLVAGYAKREHRSAVLSLEPDSSEFDIPQGWGSAKNTILRDQTTCLDLHKSDSDLLAAMDQDTRHYIRQSAAGVTIKQVRSREDLAKCLDIYHEFSKRAKAKTHDDQYYYDIFNLLGEHSIVFAAYQDDQPIAFLWLAISADIATELYEAANPEGEALHLHYALKWHAIRKMKEWELERYELASEDAPLWTTDTPVKQTAFDAKLSPVLYSLWDKVSKRYTASEKQL